MNKKANATIIIIIIIGIVIGYVFLYKPTQSQEAGAPILNPNIQTLGHFREKCTDTNGVLSTAETATEPGIVSNACNCYSETVIYNADKTFMGCN